MLFFSKRADVIHGNTFPLQYDTMIIQVKTVNNRALDCNYYQNKL